MKKPQSEKPPNEPRLTDPYESALFAAELGAAPEIDLHGETVDSALARVDAFLDHEFYAGTEAVKIIHGRGGGALRQAVRDYLKKQTHLVAAFRDAQSPGQLGGVTLVALSRRSRTP